MFYYDDGRLCCFAFAGMLISSVLIIFGLTFLFLELPRSRAQKEELLTLPGQEIGTYPELGAGTRVAITGYLSLNPIRVSDVLPIAKYEFVLYKVERWSTVHRPSGWLTEDSYHRSAYIDYGGRRLLIQASEQALITNYPHEILLPSGPSPNAEDDDPPNDSLRVFGFRNQDQVIILGVKTENGNIVFERLNGGDRSAMAAQMQREIDESKQNYILWLGVGLFILAVALGTAYFSWTRYFVPKLPLK